MILSPVGPGSGPHLCLYSSPFITNASLEAVGARIDHVFTQTYSHQHGQGWGHSSTVTLTDCKRHAKDEYTSALAETIFGYAEHDLCSIG
jgi:hypothetical protein